MRVKLWFESNVLGTMQFIPISFRINDCFWIPRNMTIDIPNHFRFSISCYRGHHNGWEKRWTKKSMKDKLCLNIKDQTVIVDHQCFCCDVCIRVRSTESIWKSYQTLACVRYTVLSDMAARHRGHELISGKFVFRQWDHQQILSVQLTTICWTNDKYHSSLYQWVEQKKGKKIKTNRPE